jgi:drug/metabolite transporter (DMT)-like permease
LILLPSALGRRQSRPYFAIMKTGRLLLLIAITAFFSTYLGIWLQQISLKYAATGIAQALSSTSPLFVMPIVRLQGETVSWRALLGAGIAFMGIWVLLSDTV